MWGPQQNFLFPFRWTHSGLFCYYVSVRNLGYIWVYIYPFRPIFVNSGEQDQIALGFDCLRTLPPLDLLYDDCTRKHTIKKYMSYGVNFWQKSLVYQEGISRIILWKFLYSQLYRSKSATLEIAYDMKINSLLCNLYFPLNQQSAKIIRT